jgi:hypothetical protein
MKIILIVLTGAILILFYGCVSVGTPIAKGSVSQIRKGVTTESELVQMFGKPISRATGSDGKLIMGWNYTSSHAKPATFIPLAGGFIGGAVATSETLSVTMDRSGRVTDYRFFETNIGTQ